MDLISLAIKARLPFIYCKTEDILYTKDTLSFIAEEEVLILPDIPESGPSGMVFPQDQHVYYTGLDVATPSLYKLFKKLNKSLVFVNTKKSVLYYDSGPLIPPKEMMLSFLEGASGSKALAEELISAFGGLTIKNSFEVIQLTRKRTSGVLNAQEINTTRQGFMPALQGITQVMTGDEFYACPSMLSDWLKDNSSFFLKPVNKSLTPRGLLFDGIPGTGKTAGAKHVAQTMGLPLFRMDVGAMKGKYVGESEQALNAGLQMVDQMSPCVVLIDEIEKVFSENHDSGVTSSLSSSLLWWLQEHQSRVFTIMTTNNRAHIPPEMFREGRVDRVLVFQGLETVNLARQFAVQVFQVVAQQVWPDTPKEIPLDVLMPTLGVLLADGKPVSQGKVTYEVNSIIKQMILKES